jgi:hypothetical protein
MPFSLLGEDPKEAALARQDGVLGEVDFVRPRPCSAAGRRGVDEAGRGKRGWKGEFRRQAMVVK